MAALYRLSVVLVAAMASPSMSEEVHVCPETVEVVDAVVVENEPTGGWSAVVDSGPLWLTGVSVYDGPVSEGAALKPETSSGGVIRWIFEGAFTRGKWLSCDYERGVVRMVRRAGDAVRSCSAIVTSDALRPTSKARYICN